MMPPILLPLLLLSVIISARELPSSTRVRNNNNASRDLIDTEEIKVEQEPCSSMSMIMSTLAIEKEKEDNNGYIQAWPSPFEKMETLSPTPSSTDDALASIYNDREEASDILDRIEDSISVGVATLPLLLVAVNIMYMIQRQEKEARVANLVKAQNIPNILHPVSKRLVKVE